jgi:hypothetical protein
MTIRLGSAAILFAHGWKTRPECKQNERTKIMTTAQPKKKPIHRISFARIVGKDAYGNDRLGPAREIGSVWPRENGKSPIIRLDLMPIELTQHQGVLFLTPVQSAAELDSDPADAELAVTAA